MSLTPEEQKALEYRQQAVRRAGFKRFLQAQLKAPVEPARTTKNNWKPLRRYC